jgi:anthranilate/para-aminobenzoate synthase component I
VPVARIEPSGDPLRDLEVLLGGGPRADAGPVPFVGGWIGALAYELGVLIEPAAAGGRDPSSPEESGNWPLVVLADCPDALVFDHADRSWHAVGQPPREPLTAPIPPPRGLRVERFRPMIGRAAHCRNVALTTELIAAGDIFQANVTQPLTAGFAGSSRELAVAALRAARPWHGGYLELPGGRAILSLSPELFLDHDARSRHVVTRPIKGTRPATDDPGDLLRSEKDAAELTMIVDLMRNDLGRVAEYGSVRVAEPRCIETHPTVHHGTAEITARLRPDAGLIDLLRATFPAGSITGAPKIRAMQVIEALEARERGPYCGSIGFFSACGRSVLNVAIRTLALRGDRPRGCAALDGGEATYGVGGGIVADSIPEAEYEECLTKAKVLELIADS